jgi:hypothetical protein
MLKTEPIEISFQYTKDDFLHAWRSYRENFFLTSKYGKPISIFLILLGIGTIINWGLNWVVAVVFFTAIEAWFDLFGELRCQWSFRVNQELFTEHYDAIIDEFGIHLRSSTLDAKRSWDGYKGIIESNRAFLLIIGKGLFSIYPKRIFKDDEQLCNFRKLINAKISIKNWARKKNI